MMYSTSTPTKKDQILSASTSLFRKSGYAGTSMNDIASAIGIKPASLYNHIASKHEILVELLMFGANLFTKGMQEIKSSNLRAIEKLEKLIALHVRLAIDYTDLMALIAVEWRHLEGKDLKSYVKLRDGYEDDFRNILKQAIIDQDIHDMDVEIALFSILTTLKWFYSWYDRHSELSSFELEKYLIQCLLGGIRS